MSNRVIDNLRAKRVSCRKVFALLPNGQRNVMLHVAENMILLSRIATQIAPRSGKANRCTFLSAACTIVSRWLSR